MEKTLRSLELSSVEVGSWFPMKSQKAKVGMRVSTTRTIFLSQAVKTTSMNAGVAMTRRLNHLYHSYRRMERL